MKKIFNSLFSMLFLLHCTRAQPVLSLEVYTSGFERPVDFTHAGDARSFVVEQDGYIWILDAAGNKLPNAFLNIDSKVGSNGNEQGLLGLAFHPNYTENGYFYVNYTNNNGDTRISRFSVTPGNANLADPNSEVVLLNADQPYSNHNGGCVKFGPDGYLYIGLGDGGSGGDPEGNGQNLNTFLGKMLRIDVDNGNPYGIPSTNPFDAGTALPEIWAFGLRNPWRFSFDRLTGDLWIGDVGQNAWEEVDFQPAGSNGGQNYGWRCYEGNHIYDTGGCPNMSTITFPVAEHSNAGGVGCSITGGFVYRGCRYPELYGRYLYTDYCTGIIWSLLPDGAGGFTKTQLANLTDNQFVSFGENRQGELFIAALSGTIYRLKEDTEGLTYDIAVTGGACPGDSDGSIALNLSGQQAPVTYLWSTGADTPALENLGSGTYGVTITNGNGCRIEESITLGSDAILSGLVTNALCPGDTNGIIDLIFTGTAPPATASWSDGFTLLNRTGLEAGEYSVTLTSDDGCELTETFTVANSFTMPEPVVTQVNDTIIAVPDIYSSYQWLRDGAFIADANSAAYTVTTVGTHQYTVQVISEDGCTGSSAPYTVVISVVTGLPGVASVKLTPNPFTQSLSLEINTLDFQQFKIKIKDLQGKTMYRDRMEGSGLLQRTFNLKNLSAGVYIVSLEAEGREWQEKVVKQ